MNKRRNRPSKAMMDHIDRAQEQLAEHYRQQLASLMRYMEGDGQAFEADVFIAHDRTVRQAIQREQDIAWLNEAYNAAT